MLNHTTRSDRWLAPACLLLIALVHGLAPFGPMVFDDVHSVVQNPAIRDLANIPRFFVDPSTFSGTGLRMFRPLVSTTLAIDYAIGGGAAWAFKLGNLVQHLLVCSMLVALLPMLFRRVGCSDHLARRASLLGVLVFGMHPLTVEAVCLVSSRSELLAALGFVVALRGWLREERRERVWRQAAWLAFGTALACCAKETGVLVPVAILLLELLVPGRRQPGGWISIRRCQQFSPAAVVGLGYLVLRKSLFGAATTTLRALHTGGDPYHGGTRDLATQLEGMTLFLPKAVFLWLFPRSLSLDHTVFLGLGWHAPSVLAGAAFVLLLLGAAFFFRRAHPLIAFAVFGAASFAAPWVCIPLNVPLAEHRLYLPVLLASIPLAVGLARLLAGARARLALRAAVGLLLAALGARTAIQGSRWLSAESIWRSTVAANPRSFRGWSALGADLLAHGRPWDAVRCLEHSIALHPRYTSAREYLLQARIGLAPTAHAPFVERTVRLAESYAEDEPGNAFARLFAARARQARFAAFGDETDIRRGAAWALSTLAMVAPKMLVFRTAAEVHRAAGQLTEALVLLETSVEYGLVDDALLMHTVEILIDAAELSEARAALTSLQRRHSPFDAQLLVLQARLHAKANAVGPWRRTVAVLARLGYDVSGLQRPGSQVFASPK